MFELLFQLGSSCAHGKATGIRAEAMGMLAVSVVTGKIHEFTNYTCDTLNVQFYADNLALINRMTEHQQYDSIYINSYLDADIDLTEEIHFCHKAHKITATFIHAKGHQDKEVAIADLDLEAQMNITADALATEYYNQGRPSKPECPLMTQCPCTFEVTQ